MLPGLRQESADAGAGDGAMRFTGNVRNPTHAPYSGSNKSVAVTVGRDGWTRHCVIGGPGPALPTSAIRTTTVFLKPFQRRILLYARVLTGALRK
jgi:hypothetical protein